MLTFCLLRRVSAQAGVLGACMLAMCDHHLGRRERGGGRAGCTSVGLTWGACQTLLEFPKMQRIVRSGRAFKMLAYHPKTITCVPYRWALRFICSSG
jgi:hypothetical protein